MARLLVWIFIITALPVALQGAATSSLEQATFFKVSLQTEQQNYVWMYRNPGSYQYVEKQEVFTEKKAKEAVTELYKKLNFSEAIKAETMVQNLKANGFNKITELKVWFRNKDDQLYTWVWSKNGGY